MGFVVGPLSSGCLLHNSKRLTSLPFGRTHSIKLLASSSRLFPRKPLSLLQATQTQDEVESTDQRRIRLVSKDLPYILRRGKPHELDLLAILSTEAFVPRGPWYDFIQGVKFTLICWDLQGQFYQRFYRWADMIKTFKPPISENRYALLVAALPNGIPVGMTEVCVSPCPMLRQPDENIATADSVSPHSAVHSYCPSGTAPYLSNLSVDKEHRRQGVGEALVAWCEELACEWGHGVMFLHVEESNEQAIRFYRRLGYSQVEIDPKWYEVIRRADLESKESILLRKFLAPSPAAPTAAAAAAEGSAAAAAGYVDAGSALPTAAAAAAAEGELKH